MPTEKQRREATRRQLQQRLDERAAQEAARKRLTLILSVAGTLAVIIVVVIVVISLSGGKSTPSTDTPVVSGGPSAGAAGYSAQKTSGPCGYRTADPASNPSLKNVGMPPDPTPTPTQSLDVRFTTNRGTIEATLDGTSAPCTVQSMAYLIGKKFYDNTPCPRVVDSGIYVVQCGSGGKDTAGGPTYTIPDENLAKADYSAGAIAMANTGQANTGSSQFFFITKDSNAGLGKQYTVVGHVTKGLDILQKVSDGGDDGSSGAVGGGAPKLPLVFKTVQIPGASPSAAPSPTLVPAG